MSDNYLNEIFEESNVPTTKPFSEVFKIEKTKIGYKITAIIPVKIENLQLNLGKIIINQNLFINNVSIFELQNKQLVGTTNLENNIFNVTGFR